MSAGARQEMLLQPPRWRSLRRAMVVRGRLLGAFCCLMTLGLPSCWAANSAESNSGDGQVTGDRSWSLRLPADDKIVFNGALNSDGAGVSSPSILYPAPNVGGFIAAVITHALIVESQKTRQIKKAQEDADKVLDPYQSILSLITYQQLARPWVEKMQPGSGRRLVGATESPRSDEWLIDATPVFLMAQDRRTLNLDNLVSIRAPGAPENIGLQYLVRVISPVVESEDPAGAWLADAGKKLNEVSVWLFSESLNIATRMAIEGTDKNDQPFQTIRYLEGTTEKMERAQLISAHCGRLLIKTLRGSLMSVPVKASTSPGSSGEMACANG